MKRPPAPPELTEAFREHALGWYTNVGPADADQPLRLYDGGPACWLKQFDPLDRPCSGRLEAIHLIGRQRIRNFLRPQLVMAEPADMPGIPAFAPEEIDEILAVIEWDPRLGGPGCTGHHRRLDGHATPALDPIPLNRITSRALDAFLEYGLDLEAERKFTGDWPSLVAARFSAEGGAAAGLQQPPPLPGVGAKGPVVIPGSAGSPDADSGESGAGGCPGRGDWPDQGVLDPGTASPEPVQSDERKS